MSELKFLDYNVKRENDVFKLPKSELAKFYEDRGVTKADLDKVNEAQDALIEEGLNFLKPHVVKEKTKQQLKCGSGDGAMTLTLHGRREFPKEKGSTEKVPKFGGAQIHIKKKVPLALRKSGGLMDDINKDIEKAYS